MDPDQPVYGQNVNEAVEYVMSELKSNMDSILSEIFELKKLTQSMNQRICLLEKYMVSQPSKPQFPPQNSHMGPIFMPMPFNPYYSNK